MWPVPEFGRCWGSASRYRDSPRPRSHRRRPIGPPAVASMGRFVSHGREGGPGDFRLQRSRPAAQVLKEPRQRHEDPRGPLNADTSNIDSSSSSGASQPSPVPELPGFYYDPEKNRYFRLLPGHNNYNPLTKENIRQREMESKRLKLLEEDQQRKKAIKSGLNSLYLHQKRQLGLLCYTSYCRRFHELKVNCMQRQKVEIRSPDFFDGTGTDHFQLLLADTTCEAVFTINSAGHGRCKYGIINLDSLWKDHLRVDMCDNFYFSNHKISAACWASVTHPDSHLLLCLMGFANTPGSVGLLPVSLFNNFSTDQPRMLCSIKIPMGWSCAWCPTPQADNCFSTGLTRRVYVTNVVTGLTQTFSTESDVLAQQFVTRTPVLYNGCRSGEIFSIDLRQNTKKSCSRKPDHFFHHSAVTSLKILQDENYVMAADMAGKIKLWDLRMRKCVKQYEGHNNQYAHLPVHINEEAGLLLAVGQDCYTRIWSLQDSQLLRTIPSPYPTSKDAIPNVIFSSQLGGKRGAPGLLMAVKQDLFHFSYNTDT